MYAVYPDAEQARVEEFGEIMKKDAYMPQSVRFAQSFGLLHMQTTKAALFTNEVMGATLSLKECMTPNENN